MGRSLDQYVSGNWTSGLCPPSNPPPPLPISWPSPKAPDRFVSVESCAVWSSGANDAHRSTRRHRFSTSAAVHPGTPLPPLCHVRFPTDTTFSFFSFSLSSFFAPPFTTSRAWRQAKASFTEATPSAEPEQCHRHQTDVREMSSPALPLLPLPLPLPHPFPQHPICRPLEERRCLVSSTFRLSRQVTGAGERNRCARVGVARNG